MLKFTSSELIKLCKIISDLNNLPDKVLTPNEKAFIEKLSDLFYPDYSFSFCEKRKLILDSAKDRAVELLISILEPKVIKIPRSHIDDFKKHPGWWAIFPEDKVDLKPRDIFEFQLSDIEVVRARVDWVGMNPTKYPNFTNWTVVEYTVINHGS